MAEHVVEDVRLLQIIEARGGADEIAGGELAAGEMGEEYLVGQEARNRHDRPPRTGEQPLVQFVEIRNPRARQEQRVEPPLERGDGPAGELAALAGVEDVPDSVLLGPEALPALRNRPVLGGARRPRRPRRQGLGEIGEHWVSPHEKTPPGDPDGVGLKPGLLSARYSGPARAIP